ncbi:MAG: homocysteine S-methyltransferase family protein [Lachnospirales bacterium]
MEFFDGAMGSLLIETRLRKKDMGCCGVLNITHSNEVINIHKGYIHAGVNFITTNTLLANKFILKNSKFTVKDVISNGLENAKIAITETKRNCKIAQSISMGGKYKTLCNDYTFQNAYELFKEQVVIGEKYGTDVFLLETFLDIKELDAAILACRENSKKPVFATMPFKENSRTLLDAYSRDLSELANKYALDAVGVNCCFGANIIKDAITDIKKHTKSKIIVQPNRGMPQVVNGKSIYTVSINDFVDEVKDICKIGVDYVGGCCGTNPDVIKKTVKKLNM